MHKSRLKNVFQQFHVIPIDPFLLNVASKLRLLLLLQHRLRFLRFLFTLFFKFYVLIQLQSLCAHCIHFHSFQCYALRFWIQYSSQIQRRYYSSLSCISKKVNSSTQTNRCFCISFNSGISIKQRLLSLWQSYSFC